MAKWLRDGKEGLWLLCYYWVFSPTQSIVTQRRKGGSVVTLLLLGIEPHTKHSSPETERRDSSYFVTVGYSAPHKACACKQDEINDKSILQARDICKIFLM